MAIPFHTTTISILRSDAVAGSDGYPDTAPNWPVHARAIRAVIGAPSGSFMQAGSLQEVVTARMSCDPCDLQFSDRVLDESTNETFVVKWLHLSRGFGLDHVSADLRIVEGYID